MVAQWQSSDAWVFAALQGSGIDDGCTLAQVIATGDAINHAILMEEEFTRAIPRLVNAGLVGADPAEDRYWHTDAGRELYERSMKRRGLFGWIDAIPPALQRLGPPEDGDLVLPPGAFERAWRTYHRHATAAIERLTPSRRRHRRTQD